MKTFMRILALLIVMAVTAAAAFHALCENGAEIIRYDIYGAEEINGGTFSRFDRIEAGQVLAGKDVEYIGGGAFEITLSAAARGFGDRSEWEASAGYDVVFVLDYSASMDERGKLDNMIAAAVTSMNTVLASNGGGGEHFNRVAAVGYHESAFEIIPWETVGVDGQRLPRDTRARTNIMAGMNAAYQTLAARSDASRPSVIVLMSDGQPNGYYTPVGGVYNHTRTGTSGATSLSGANANDDSVFHTIMNTVSVARSIPGLEIYSIGFDISGFSSAQRAYAYAALNPSRENIANLGSSLRNRLGGTVNPVSRFADADADSGEIMYAFTTIVESITRRNPLNGFMRIRDTVDGDAYEIDWGAGGKPDYVGYTGGELIWTVTGLDPMYHPDDAVSVPIDPEHISTLKFTLRLKEEKYGSDNRELIYYTNTRDYASGSVWAQFRPMTNNPYLYSADSSYEDQGDGSLRRYLPSTGIITLVAVYAPIVTEPPEQPPEQPPEEPPEQPPEQPPEEPPEQPPVDDPDPPPPEESPPPEQPPEEPEPSPPPTEVSPETAPEPTPEAPPEASPETSATPEPEPVVKGETAEEPPDVPRTGDGASLWVIIALAGISGTALLAVAKKAR